MKSEARYHRHLALPGWDQARLRDATLVIVGVGALGNVLAQSLGLAGVGRLILCDMDRIEESNLSRAPLFTPADLGRLKVEAARDGLARIAPDTRVEVRPEPLESGIGLAELRDASLVLGCLDSRAARLELAGRCGLIGAPWIDGATGSWNGEVRPYLDPDGPCYGCGGTVTAAAPQDATPDPTPDPTPEGTLEGNRPPNEDDRQSCRVPGPTPAAGATAPLSALVGDLMALLTVRHLLGLTVPPGILDLDGATGTVTRVHQTRDPHCPYHHRLPAPRALALGPDPSVGDLLAALPPDATPLAWRPFQLKVQCPRCGLREERPGRPEPAACPACGAPLRPRTSLEVNQAPALVKLREIGIPAREILAVRRAGGIETIELI